MAALLALTAGSGSTPEPPDVAWRSVELGGTVTALTACGGTWFAAGSVPAAPGSDSGPGAGEGTGLAAGQRPAAWTSADGQHWMALPTTSRSVYGKVSRLSSVACRSATAVAALGAATGGAHGSPRPAAWASSRGALRELPAAFELFGGWSAVSVVRIVGGPAGWLIVGGWVTAGRGGAAAWQARPASIFAPATSPGTLASRPGEQTAASDAAGLGNGWLVGGSTTPLTGPHAGLRTPLAWRSSPTGWVREQLPSDPAADAGVERMAAAGSDVVAAGTVLPSKGGRFVFWRRSAGHWNESVTISPVKGTGSVVPAVRDLAVSGARVLVATGDGHRLRLWLSTDAGRHWREVGLPAGAPRRDDGSARLAVAVEGSRAVLTVGAGDSGRSWFATLPS